MMQRERCTLGEICRIDSALVDPRDDNYQNLLHVGGANIESRTGRLIDLQTAKEEKLVSGKFVFDERMVLYSKIRPYLMKVARPSFKGLCSADIYPLLPLDGFVDRGFLFYMLLSEDFTAFAVGGSGRAGMPKVNRDHLFAYTARIPRLDEQRRVVGILDQVFEGVAVARANVEESLRNSRALFEATVHSAFASSGDVVRKLGEICSIASPSVDPRKPEFLDLIHVGAANIESQTGILLGLKTARREGLISPKYLFDDSVVLYSKIRPYLMKVARPEFGGLCSADMYPLTPSPQDVNRDYLFHLLLSKSFTDYAIDGSARAGMPKVNREHLFEFNVQLPTLKKQREISLMLDELRDETQRLAAVYQRKLVAIEALKMSVLHQAFSGHL